MTASFPKLFKFRPECIDDVDRLREALDGLVGAPGETEVSGNQIVAVNPELAATDPLAHNLGEAIFEFEAQDPAHLAAVLGAMLRLADCHRMWQTIDTAENFTGDFVTDEEARGGRILDSLGQAMPGIADRYADLMEIKQGATPGL